MIGTGTDAYTGSGSVGPAKRGTGSNCPKTNLCPAGTKWDSQKCACVAGGLKAPGSEGLKDQAGINMNGPGPAKPTSSFKGGGTGFSGGGGGGGGATTGGSKGAASGTGAGLAGTIESTLTNLLKGQGTRFTDPVMQMLQGQALSQRETAREQGLQALQGAAVRSGANTIGRSGAMLGAQANVIRGTASDFGQQLQNLQIQKVNADWEDKVSALKLGMDYLDQTRDFWIRSNLVDVEREKIGAQLSLGYANIATQRYIADQQLELGLGGLALENKKLDMTALGLFG